MIRVYERMIRVYERMIGVYERMMSERNGAGDDENTGLRIPIQAQIAMHTCSSNEQDDAFTC